MTDTPNDWLTLISHVSIGKDHLACARRLTLDMQDPRPSPRARGEISDAYWHLERALRLLKKAATSEVVDVLRDGGGEPGHGVTGPDVALEDPDLSDRCLDNDGGGALEDPIA